MDIDTASSLSSMRDAVARAVSLAPTRTDSFRDDAQQTYGASSASSSSGTSRGGVETFDVDSASATVSFTSSSDEVISPSSTSTFFGRLPGRNLFRELDLGESTDGQTQIPAAAHLILRQRTGGILSGSQSASARVPAQKSRYDRTVRLFFPL